MAAQQQPIVPQTARQPRAKAKAFRRYEVGEGIEKAVTDFAAEVKATAGL